MENSPDKVLKAIPDFEEFMKLSNEIAVLMYKKLSLDAQIKEGESDVFRIATTDEQYFQGGKPPSSTAIDNTFKYTGFNKELIPLRNELAKTVSELEGKKLQMDVYKQMIDIWRTLCSNNRTSGF